MAQWLEESWPCGWREAGSQTPMMKGGWMGETERWLYGVYAWFTVIARQSKRVTAYLHITRRCRRQLDEKQRGGRRDGVGVWRKNELK